MTTIQERNPSNRLQFIDMARSIAIILMLEGHFTGAALDDVYRDSQYPLYTIWATIHGLTKPLFFIVTGLIFSYLLLAHKELSFRKNPRVKLGLKRVLQLLFWGYFIQLNLLSIFKSIKLGYSFNLEWMAAFHVLQALAVGILLLILVYGVYALIRKGNILWYYVVATFVALFFQGELLFYVQEDQEYINYGLQEIPEYWPTNAPAFIQNMFYGKFSDFNFISTTPLVFMGAILGIIIRSYEKNIRTFRFGLLLVAVGLLFKTFAFNFTWMLDSLLSQNGTFEFAHFHLAHYSVARFGEVIVLIGVLIWIEKYLHFKMPLFLKIGQNTFAIYVIHIIILYGGIFGIGLKPRLFDHNLHPIYAVFISAAAILFFTIITKHIEPLERFYFAALQRIGLKRMPNKAK
jgi:hypothetical protein